MMVNVEINHIIFYNCNILFQGKERTTLMPAKLRAVLICAESDSARCESAQSPTLRNVSQSRV